MNWRLVGRPLDPRRPARPARRPRLGGVWAPCLSYADGLFWLIYTDVKRFDGTSRTPTTTSSPRPRSRPWSDPIYSTPPASTPRCSTTTTAASGSSTSSGATPPTASAAARAAPPSTASRPGVRPVARRLTGPIRIFAGSPPAPRRGPAPLQAQRLVLPHHRRGRHRLRPRRDHGPRPRLLGPTSSTPTTHLITSKDAPDAPLQRAGHGQIVETPTAVYHTHLCSRPLPGTRATLSAARLPSRTALGDDGWLYLAHGGHVPAAEVCPAGRPRSRARSRHRYRFDGPPPAGLPVAAHALPRAPLHPDRRRRSACTPRIDRLVVRSGARRPPTAASRLPRRDPAHAFAPDTTSRPPASRPTTTAPSSTFSPSPTTEPAAS